MGRPRKPVQEHLKNGTYRADRHGPVLSDDIGGERPAPPTKPADLKGEASAVWDQVVPLLAGVARERDSRRLADLCRWWARLDAIAGELDEFALGDAGYNRALIALGICEDKVNNLGKQFGLTPESRAKLKPEVAAGPVAAQVPTRPRTKLDLKGPPK